MPTPINREQLQVFRQKLKELTATLSMVAELPNWFPKVIESLDGNDGERLEELYQSLRKFTSRGVSQADCGTQMLFKSELAEINDRLDRNLTARGISESSSRPAAPPAAGPAAATSASKPVRSKISKAKRGRS